MRTISGPATTLLSSAAVGAVILLKMELTSTVYLNSTPDSLLYDGETWTGAGSLGAIDEVRESAGEYAALKFSLSGVPSDLLSLALSEPVRNKPVTLYLAIVDPDDNSIVDAPVIWSGLLDTMSVQQSGETCVISVTAEPTAVEFARPKPFKYSDADQQRYVSVDSPGVEDTSMRFTVSQAMHQDIWPAAAYWSKKQS